MYIISKIKTNQKEFEEWYRNMDFSNDKTPNYVIETGEIKADIVVVEGVNFTIDEFIANSKKKILLNADIPCYNGNNINEIIEALKKVNKLLQWKTVDADRLEYCAILECVAGVRGMNELHEYLERSNGGKEET